MAPPAATYSEWHNNTNPRWWRDRGLRRMAMHIVALYLCVFTFGYDGSLLNGLQTVPRWQRDFDRPLGHTLGLIGASFYLPKIPAPYLASFLADKFGRRVALLVGSVICVIGALVNTFANGRGMLIGGRVILGVGTGMQATIAAPMVQELCHPRMRAIAGGMYLSSFYVGSTFAAWLCFGMINWDNSWAWRLPTLFQALGSFITGTYIATGFMAESPRWLLNVGRNEQALRTLAAMHANGDESDELVQVEFNEIKAGLQADREAKGNTYRALISTPGNRKRLLVLVVTAAATQLNGTGLVSYYLAPILRLIGITQPAQQAGINGGLAIWNFITTITAAQFVERIGRRPLWLTGHVGVLCVFTIVTGLSGAFASNRNEATGIAVIPFLYIFYLFYNMAWATLANLYVAEILPFSLRSKGMSIYVMTQSTSLAFNQYVNPVALGAIQWKYYIVYLGVQAALIVFAYFFYIETKGRTIEEVSRLFDGKEQARQIQEEGEGEVRSVSGDKEEAVLEENKRA